MGVIPFVDKRVGGWQVKPCDPSLTRATRERFRDGKKVKFSHTRYRALRPELIPVYRQSARR